MIQSRSKWDLHLQLIAKAEAANRLNSGIKPEMKHDYYKNNNQKMETCIICRVMFRLFQLFLYTFFFMILIGFIEAYPGGINFIRSLLFRFHE
jgi:hypothetical protein